MQVFFLLKELCMYRKRKLFKQKFFVYRVLRNVKQDMYIHKCKSDNRAKKIDIEKETKHCTLDFKKTQLIKLNTNESLSYLNPENPI